LIFLDDLTLFKLTPAQFKTCFGLRCDWITFHQLAWQRNNKNIYEMIENIISSIMYTHIAIDLQN